MDGLETVDDGIFVQLPVQNPRQQELLWELITILRTEWAYHTREDIYEVQAGASRGSFLIRWREGEDIDENVLGGYTSALLKHGWAISGLKNNMTFVSPIRESAEEDVAYRFEGESGDSEELNMYRPKPCEVCGVREHVAFIDVEAEVEDFERRIEENEYIPRFWVKHIRLCDECDLPEKYTEYERGTGPDFNPSNYPEYNPWGTN